MRQRMTKVDWMLLPLAVGGLLVVAGLAFRYLGFLGIGILGLLTGLVAVNVDLQRGWPIGPTRLNTYADRIGVEGQMTRAERAAFRAELERDQVPIFVAKVVAAGMVILGFGLFFMFQLPG